MQSEAAPRQGWDRRYIVAAGFALSGVLTLGGAGYELLGAVQDAGRQNIHAEAGANAALHDRQMHEVGLWAGGSLLALAEFGAAAYCGQGAWNRFMRADQPWGYAVASAGAPPHPGQAASPAPISVPQAEH